MTSTLLAVTSASKRCRRGRPVVVVEKDAIGAQASGVNFGNVRLQGRFLGQIPLALRAHSLWEDIEALIGAAEPAPSANGAKRPPVKRGAAVEAINACFPNGVPDEVEMPDGPLCAVLSPWLKTNYPALPMHDKTILRAVGRVK